MSKVQRGRHRLAGAVGAVAAGLGAAPSTEAAIVFAPVNADIPPTYAVDLDGDAAKEFEISEFASVTKIGGFAAGAGVVTDAGDGRTANLAPGTLIGPGSTFSSGVPEIVGGLAEDQLNGTDTGTPVGHFQPTDPAGFIGVKFLIGGAVHYGYVGYQGTGTTADATGHVYGIGYESTPDAAIEAGAGIPEPTSLHAARVGNRRPGVLSPPAPWQEN